jgi:hypothetical protein
MILFAKRLSVLILLQFLLPFCSFAGSPAVSSGRVERLDLFPSVYVTPRTVDVWLPEGYPAGGPYAVVYFHDGQMLFDSTDTWNHQEWGVDETFSRLQKSGKLLPCIVVGIWNGGKRRGYEYFPQRPFESLTSAAQDSLYKAQRSVDSLLLPEYRVQSDDYLSFIVKELKPFIDSSYRTDPRPQSTVLMGSSMGGLVSMYGMCEYPMVFGGAGCLSTHWLGTYSVAENPIPKAFLDYLYANLPDPATHRLYFDRGTETLDSFYEPYQVIADGICRSRGYAGKNFMTLVYKGDDHTERSWARRLEQPAVFLLGQ